VRIARQRPEDLHTPRLRLRPTTTALLRAELAGNRALAAALGAVVPDGWPPGEHNLHAVRYFLDNPGLLLDGWSDYYAITRAGAGNPPTLVASIGFQGPPNRAGRVEVGYSVVESWRRRGVATEAVSAMVERARVHGLRAIIAHARPDNHASIAVLTKSGFRPGLSTREGQLGFERPLFTVRRAAIGELSAINAIYRGIKFEASTPDDQQLVADSGGEVVGLGRLVRVAAPDDDSATVHQELGGIWVAPHLRGEGAAQAIVRRLIETAGGQRVACVPFAHLEPLYAAFGFVRWSPASAPAGLQRKLERCAAAHEEPVLLMILHRP
jgi:[ribosomal protein S5]-alanine N-acetyltransferase